MNIISGCKNVCHFIFSAIELIRKNIFLFIRLVCLVISSMFAGIAVSPLLSFFNEGKRHWPWYMDHFFALGGLTVSSVFIVYLIIHIIEKQTHSEVKRAKAEHKIRAKETETEKYFHFHEERPRTERLVAYTKEKLLRLPWKKDE